VHGGAGRRPISAKQARCLEQALIEGYRRLSDGMPAVQTVEIAIRILEASGLFNAGLGSNRQLDQIQRMDASIMEGRTLRAGAVASIERVMHPITAARFVMERTPHVLLAGAPARQFAGYVHVEPLPRDIVMRRRPGSRQRDRSTAAAVRLFQAMTRRGAMRKASGQETVGAVALAVKGTVAAGASTGGVDVMLPGRVGDTPLIGCGVYADDEAGAVSMTGLGESIIRVSAAKEIADLLELGWTSSRAAGAVLRKLVRRTGGSAGAIVLSPSGSFAIRHVTPRMAAGHWDGTGSPIVRDRFS
jgi:beta-aspartyl-peptidase (threonine type)